MIQRYEIVVIVEAANRTDAMRQAIEGVEKIGLRRAAFVRREPHTLTPEKARALLNLLGGSR